MRLLCDLGPEGPETPVNGGSGRNSSIHSLLDIDTDIDTDTGWKSSACGVLITAIETDAESDGVQKNLATRMQIQIEMLWELIP